MQRFKIFVSVPILITFSLNYMIYMTNLDNLLLLFICFSLLLFIWLALVGEFYKKQIDLDKTWQIIEFIQNNILILWISALIIWICFSFSLIFIELFFLLSIWRFVNGLPIITSIFVIIGSRITEQYKKIILNESETKKEANSKGGIRMVLYSLIPFFFLFWSGEKKRRNSFKRDSLMVHNNILPFIIIGVIFINFLLFLFIYFFSFVLFLMVLHLIIQKEKEITTQNKNKVEFNENVFGFLILLLLYPNLFLIFITSSSVIYNIIIISFIIIIPFIMLIIFRQSLKMKSLAENNN